MQKLPTPGKLEKNLIDSIAQQGTTDIYNGLVDKAGAIHKRPGLALNQEIDVEGGIQALYYWPSKDLHVAVAGGVVYATSSLTEAYASVTETDVTLAAGPAKIVDTGSWLYIAGTSGKIIKWDGGEDPADYEDDAVAPTDVSAITLLNQRIIANERESNKIWFTLPRSLTTPTAALEWSSYITYGRDNEEIVGLEISGGELVAFKRDSMQAFFDDAVTPLKPIIGSNKFYGLIAPSAICRMENALFFVSPDRTIRMLQDREVRDISTPEMGRELQKLKAFEDVVVYPLDLKIVFSVPGEDVCYVFDPILRNWSQFTSINDADEEIGFIGRCTAQVPAEGETDLWLVGGSDSNVYFWDYSSFNDNGNPINFLIRTPQQSWQTSNRKQSTRLVTRISTESLRGPDSPLERAYVSPSPAYTHSEDEYEGSIIAGTGYTITGVTGLPDYLTAEAGTEPEDPWPLTGILTENRTVSFFVQVVDGKGANYNVPVSLPVLDEPITMVLGQAALVLPFRDRYGKCIVGLPEEITDATLTYGTYDENYEFYPMDETITVLANSSFLSGEVAEESVLGATLDIEPDPENPLASYPTITVPNVAKLEYTYKGWKYSTTINAWDTLTIKQAPTEMSITNDSTGLTGKVTALAQDISIGGGDLKFFTELVAAYGEGVADYDPKSSIIYDFGYQTVSTIDDLQAMAAMFFFATAEGDVDMPADTYMILPFTTDQAALNLRTGRFTIAEDGEEDTVAWNLATTLRFRAQYAPVAVDYETETGNVTYNGIINAADSTIFGSDVQIKAFGRAWSGMGLFVSDLITNLSLWLVKKYVPTRSRP